MISSGRNSTTQVAASLWRGAFVVMAATCGCSPAVDAERDLLATRCLESAQELHEVRLDDLAETLLDRAAPEPSRSSDDVKARLFRAYATIERPQRAWKYASAVDVSRLAELIMARIEIDYYSLLEPLRANLTALTAADALLLARCYADLGAWEAASQLCLQAADVHRNGRAELLSEAVALGAEIHDIPTVQEALARLGPAQTATRDDLRRRAFVTSFERESRPGPWFLVDGIGDDGVVVCRHGGRNPRTPIVQEAGSRPCCGPVKIPLGTLEGSFEVSLTIVVHALPWNRRFFAVLSTRQPELYKNRTLEKVDESRIAALELKAMSGTRKSKFTVSSDNGLTILPDLGKLDGVDVSTGTKREIVFWDGSNGSSKHGGNFEYGEECRLRISYWAPLDELVFAAQRVGHPKVSVRRVARPDGFPAGEKHLYLLHEPLSPGAVHCQVVKDLEIWTPR